MDKPIDERILSITLNINDKKVFLGNYEMTAYNYNELDKTIDEATSIIYKCLLVELSKDITIKVLKEGVTEKLRIGKSLFENISGE